MQCTSSIIKIIENDYFIFIVIDEVFNLAGAIGADGTRSKHISI